MSVSYKTNKIWIIIRINEKRFFDNIWNIHSLYENRICSLYLKIIFNNIATTFAQISFILCGFCADEPSCDRLLNVFVLFCSQKGDLLDWERPVLKRSLHAPYVCINLKIFWAFFVARQKLIFSFCWNFFFGGGIAISFF